MANTTIPGTPLVSQPASPAKPAPVSSGAPTTTTPPESPPPLLDTFQPHAAPRRPFDAYGSGASPLGRALEAIETLAATDGRVVKGAKGDQARRVQKALELLGYPLEADGDFGKGTAKQFMAFVEDQFGASASRLSPAQRAGDEVSGEVLHALARSLASKQAATERLASGLDTLVSDLSRGKPNDSNGAAATLKRLGTFTGSLQAHVDSISALGDDTEKAAKLEKAFKTLEERALATQLSPAATAAWEAFSDRAKAEIRQGTVVNAAREIKTHVLDLKAQRLQESIGIISDELRAADPSGSAAIAVVNGANDVLALARGDGANKAQAVADAYAKLQKLVHENWSKLSEDGGRARWGEFTSTMDQAIASGRQARVARFMHQAYLNHLLDQLANGSKDGASGTLSVIAQEQLRELERRAEESEHRPITAEVLQRIVPSLTPERAQKIAPELNQALAQANITSPRQKAAFISQCAHESGGFRYMKELGSASYFARYDGRADLGNTEPGDGARFCGRGWLQLTGRTNYTKCSKDLRAWGLLGPNEDLVRQPELAETARGAVLVSIWYWKTRDLNEPAGDGNNTLVSRIVNGGTNGLQDRMAYYARALSELTVD